MYTDEALAEADAHFETRAAYIRSSGGLAFSVNIHTVDIAMRFMTGPAFEE